jgi:putative ABC transport system ATP-binding protein
VAPENYLPRLTILENLLYGRISAVAGLQGDLVRDVAIEVLEKHEMQQLVSEVLFDLPTAIGGDNLATHYQERAAYGRAAIKRPDVLIFNQLLSDEDADAQAAIRDRLSDLLPQTTQIYLNDSFSHPDAFDLHVKIHNGRIDGVAETQSEEERGSGSDDLRRKLRIISRTELFANLDARSRRLLAFAAQWYTVDAGTTIFSEGERADAAYLCLEGRSELAWVDPSGKGHHVSEVAPGRLIGDLAIILDEPRQLDLTAITETKFLRIGAEQFLSVIENDKDVLRSLLRTVSGHLSSAADQLIEARVEMPREGPLIEPDGEHIEQKDLAEVVPEDDEVAWDEAQAEADAAKAKQDTSTSQKDT